MNKQSKTMSLVESMTNVIVGFGVATGGNALLFPLVGLSLNIKQNLFVATVLTFVSICRSFILRRVFEYIRVRNVLHQHQ